MRKPRIYIIPTKFGGVFLCGACVMLLAGAVYQNNLVNLLAFFMFSLVFVAMVQTHNNLKDVIVEAVDITPGFVGAEYVVTCILRNRSNTSHFNLETSLRKLEPALAYENRLPLLPSGTLKIKSAYLAVKRGHFVLHEVKISTIFPLGLFYAWSWQKVDSPYFIYPAIKGQRQLPDTHLGDESSKANQFRKGGDDFHGHRRYERGDSHRHVDWKARARGRPMLVKEFNEGSNGSVFLSWKQLEGMSTEEKLSQLTAWVEDAKQRHVLFALQTPEGTLSTNGGSAHAARCLEHLAAFGSLQETVPTTRIRGFYERLKSAVG
jgi:uncharacterized protein (DUF58 family)